MSNHNSECLITYCGKCGNEYDASIEAIDCPHLMIEEGFYESKGIQAAIPEEYSKAYKLMNEIYSLENEIRSHQMDISFTYEENQNLNKAFYKCKKEFCSEHGKINAKTVNCMKRMNILTKMFKANKELVKEKQILINLLVAKVEKLYDKYNCTGITNF